MYVCTVAKVVAHFGRHPDVNSQLNYTYMYSRINLQKISNTLKQTPSVATKRHNTKNFTAQQSQKEDNSTTWLITCTLILVGYCVSYLYFDVYIQHFS